jgi:hypothetical protein
MDKTHGRTDVLMEQLMVVTNWQRPRTPGGWMVLAPACFCCAISLVVGPLSAGTASDRGIS